MKKCLECAAAFDGAEWRCPSCGREPRREGGIPIFAPELVDGDGTDADYPYDALVRAETLHFWFRNRAALISRMIRQYFPAAKSILEVGCGAGGVLLQIQSDTPGARLRGSELLVRGLLQAKQKLADIELLQMDARRIPFENEFDVVGAFDVLEHIDDDDSVLRQMHGAVLPGGGIVVTVPQHPWLWSRFDELCGHRRRYTRSALVGKLRAGGFEPVRLTSFTAFALPLLFAARSGRRNMDLREELMVPPAGINSVLFAIGSLERSAIYAGASFPAGGSLLAVAVKRR